MRRIMIGAMVALGLAAQPAHAQSDAWAAGMFGAFAGLAIGGAIANATRPPPAYYVPMSPSPHVVWSPWQPYNPPIVYHRPQPTCGLIQVGTDHFGQPITQVFCR